MPLARRSHWVGILFLLIVASVAVLVLPSAGLSDAPALTVTFLDVGQGDSIWIVTPDGQDILIDGGPEAAGPMVRQYLQDHGCTGIEYLILTHPHLDHYGGLTAVLNALPASLFWYGQQGSGSSYSQFWNLVTGKGVPASSRRAGDTYSLGAVTILILHPATIGSDTNDNSIVCRVSYGTVDFLLTGDATEAAEAEMLGNGRPLEAEVLKVGHHGSRYSSTLRFLQAVSPDVAVISVGAGNPYGHPTQETLDRLVAVGATVYRTDQHGTVVATTNGSTYSVRPLRFAWSWHGYLPLAMRPPASTPSPTATATATSVPPTHTPTVTATASSTPTPTSPSPGANSLRISHLQYSGSDEYVEITNDGPGAQVMTGWRIWSVVGNQTYYFPSGYMLPAGAYVRVHSGAEAINNPPTDLKWSTAYIWNNDGDEARLINASGQTVDSWAY